MAPKEKVPAIQPAGEGSVVAPLTGKIISVMVEKGDSVKAGQLLFILEAMKMSNEIFSPISGIVKQITVSVGDIVEKGSVIFLIQ